MPVLPLRKSGLMPRPTLARKPGRQKDLSRFMTASQNKSLRPHKLSLSIYHKIIASPTILLSWRPDTLYYWFLLSLSLSPRRYSLSTMLLSACSSPFCLVLIHFTSPHFNQTCSLPSHLSDLLWPLHLLSAHLWFLSSCSSLLTTLFTCHLDQIGLDRLSLDELTQFWSIFFSSGQSNFSSNNLPLGSNSPSSSVYYNIEVINKINIDFIVKIVTRIQSLTGNTEGILVLNSDPDSHLYPGCTDQAQNWFWNLRIIKSTQKANPE